MRATALFLLMASLAVVTTGCGEKKNATFGTVGQKIGEASPEGAPDRKAKGGPPVSAVKAPSLDSPSGGERTEESAPKSKDAPTTTPPKADVADPVVGREMSKKPKQNLPSGILTAGSFDDNVDPLNFQKYVKNLSQRSGF